MKESPISPDDMLHFYESLRSAEKSPVTVDKYTRDLKAFLSFARERPLSKALVLDYKQQLISSGYSVRSINSMLSSLNAFLRFSGREDCRVKCLKLQRQIYSREDKELSKAEYLRLLSAAEHRPQLHMLLETICATGIRVSELRFFDLEGVRRGEVSVSCKGKNRLVFIPEKLKKRLLTYCRRLGIRSGPIFRTRTGRPLDRSNIWSQMKSLCAAAGVAPGKVFPHNLRKLFARTFYSLDRDLAKLADILGHSSIDTTRIYIISTGAEHRKKIERLGLVV